MAVESSIWKPLQQFNRVIFTSLKSNNEIYFYMSLLFHFFSAIYFLLYFSKVLEIKGNKTKTNGPSPQKAFKVLLEE